LSEVVCAAEFMPLRVENFYTQLRMNKHEGEPMSGNQYRGLMTSEFKECALHGMAYVQEDAPALSVMSDFAYHRPGMIGPEETLARASARMKSASDHLLLVVKNPDANKDKPGDRVIGQITACDIMGDEPLRISRDTGLRHDEIPVRMVMTPSKEIRVLDWEIASRVKVGNILATMKEQDCCHLLVVEQGELRGIFSRSEINKHLQHADMEQLGCAHSLADLIHRVA